MSGFAAAAASRVWGVGVMSEAVALKRAQAYNETLTRHVLALIETVEQRGAPNGPTLIAACEGMLRAAFQAGEEAANTYSAIRKLKDQRDG